MYGHPVGSRWANASVVATLHPCQESMRWNTHLEELLRPDRQPQSPRTLPQNPQGHQGCHGPGSHAAPFSVGIISVWPIAACYRQATAMHASDCADRNRGACTAVHPRASFTRPTSNSRCCQGLRPLTKHMASKPLRASRVVDCNPPHFVMPDTMQLSFAWAALFLSITRAESGTPGSTIPYSSRQIHQDPRQCPAWVPYVATTSQPSRSRTRVTTASHARPVCRLSSFRPRASL